MMMAEKNMRHVNAVKVNLLYVHLSAGFPLRRHPCPAFVVSFSFDLLFAAVWKKTSRDS